MQGKEIKPVWAIVAIVVLVAIAGGVWYYRTNPGAGGPAAGEAGRADTHLSGPTAVMKGGGGSGDGGGTGGRPRPGARPMGGPMGGPGQPGGQ